MTKIIEKLNIEGKVSQKHAEEIEEIIQNEIEKHLNWWKEDIISCFIPKCSCGKPATTRTTRGEDAQKNNYRPVNWGHYCDKCFKEGLELEEEAMYS